MVCVVLTAVVAGPALVSVDLGVSSCRTLKIALTDRDYRMHHLIQESRVFWTTLKQ